MTRRAKKGFGWHVAKLLKPRLRELGLRPRGSSKVLYERPVPPALMEYVVWVCHREHDEFHIQWGIRHWLNRWLCGLGGLFSLEESIRDLKYSDESELVDALARSFAEWRQQRDELLPRMERGLRRDRKAKEKLLRWHRWWGEFREAKLDNLAGIEGLFRDLPRGLVEDALRRINREVAQVPSEQKYAVWKSFMMLRKVRENPRKFKGNWRDLLSDDAASCWFFDHLGDLDALLEPYDV